MGEGVDLRGGLVGPQPDDPGEMEILSIKYAGNDFDLSDEQREKIEAECWEDMEDRRDA